MRYSSSAGRAGGPLGSGYHLAMTPGPTKLRPHVRPNWVLAHARRATHPLVISGSTPLDSGPSWSRVEFPILGGNPEGIYVRRLPHANPSTGVQSFQHDRTNPAGGSVRGPGTNTPGGPMQAGYPLEMERSGFDSRTDTHPRCRVAHWTERFDSAAIYVRPATPRPGTGPLPPRGRQPRG